VVGIFVIDELESPINFQDFNGEINKIIKFYGLIGENNLPQEFTKLLEELSENGYNEFIVDNSNLSNLINQNSNFNAKHEVPCPLIQSFKLNLINSVNKYGVQITEDQIRERSKKLGESLAKKSISRASGKDDILIIQMSNTLDLLKKTINLFSTRIREWYGLHFPELTDKIIEDHVVFSKLISIIGSRENFTKENLQDKFSFKDYTLNEIITQSQNSMGAEIDLDNIQKYADLILSIESYRTRLENGLDEIMNGATPNLTTLVGALIGAKLVASVGSIKKLAMLPASTIQLLGAERALFRSLKSNAKSPKHGIIFQWHGIRSAKPWHRGKISRLLSGKISIAAKLDYFSDKLLGDQLLNEVNQKIEEIKRKYPNPPKKSQKKSQNLSQKKRSKKRR